jgi:riboflavin synthase
MFTGLVQAVGVVRSARSAGTGRVFLVESEFEGLALGESIAHDGVCLTVEAVQHRAFQVTAGEETLKRTTLSEYSPGCRVHLERALLPMDRLGGHFVTGHVDGIARIVRVDRRPGFVEIEVALPEALAIYIVEKGSVTLDGVSLTINRAVGSHLEVGIIPHTAAVTRFGDAAVGQRLNVEVDLVARHVRHMLAAWLEGDAGGDRRLREKLRSHGFLGEDT